MKKLFVLAIGIAVFFNSATNAHAYLDPGSGSFVIQAIAAMALGTFVGIKVFWRKFKMLFFKFLLLFKPQK
jgi:hypothetical protein